MKTKRLFEGLRYCLILHSAFFILHCQAASSVDGRAALGLPRAWQVNAGVGRVVDLPAAFHGEEIALRADFTAPDGQPFALPEGDWKLYFQTNGMDALYFGPFPASASSNSVSAVFSPTNDPGAAQITGYLALPGSIYHAAFRLRFLPSPGATPNVLPLPSPSLNFATTTILNPPWPAEIESLSNTLSHAIADATPADYATVSNLAYSAVQPDALCVTNDYLRLSGGTVTGAVTLVNQGISAPGVPSEMTIAPGRISGQYQTWQIPDNMIAGPGFIPPTNLTVASTWDIGSAMTATNALAAKTRSVPAGSLVSLTRPDAIWTKNGADYAGYQWNENLGNGMGRLHVISIAPPAGWEYRGDLYTNFDELLAALPYGPYREAEADEATSYVVYSDMMQGSIASATNAIAAAKWPWSSITNAPAATTGVKGIVQLSTSTNSTSTTMAATPSAVRDVARVANAAATRSQLAAATNALDRAKIDSRRFNMDAFGLICSNLDISATWTVDGQTFSTNIPLFSLEYGVAIFGDFSVLGVSLYITMRENIYGDSPCIWLISDYFYAENTADNPFDAMRDLPSRDDGYDWYWYITDGTPGWSTDLYNGCTGFELRIAPASPEASLAIEEHGEYTEITANDVCLRNEVDAHKWPWSSITNAPGTWAWSAISGKPAWIGSSKPTYTPNEIFSAATNWIGVQGNAGRVIRILAGTVANVIVGGFQITGSTLNDNNMTSYLYNGVAVKRNGVNTDYLWDATSPNGVVRKSQLSAEAQRIDTITSYLAGGDAKVVFTNDPQRIWAPMHSFHVKTGNVWQVVWDEAEVASSNALEMAELRSALDDKADRAWGYYDSHTGNWSPDGYTWVSSPKIGIGGGLAYQRVAATEGAIWVLCSSGLAAQTGGTTNGYFRVEDDEGNAQLEIVKGDRRTVGANPASLTTSVSGGRTHLHLTYAIQSAEHPVLRIAADISNPAWLPETDPGCVANVTWSGQSGSWTADVSGKQAYSTLFVKGEYAVGGESLINAPIPLKLSHIYIGSQKYAIGTAEISGSTVLTLTPTL